jgi:two-component system sensor histidine kinase YesM
MTAASNKNYRSIRTKLIQPVGLVMAVLLALTLFFFYRINRTMEHLNEVYATNVSLNEVEDHLHGMQQNMFQYLNVQNEDSLTALEADREAFSASVAQLSTAVTDNEAKLLEANIYHLSQSYLELAAEAEAAKKTHNAAAYRSSYGEMETVYNCLLENIRALDTLRFQANSENYDILSRYLGYLEIYMTVVLIAVTAFLVGILYRRIQNITQPLEQLAVRARRVSAGDFDVAMAPAVEEDEVGTVSMAFNQMVASLQEYIQKQQENMRTEMEMKERQLKNETLLKDAQLKYYQAQINPHFLFNTLNAGQQLAMMEGADKTYEFLDNTASFFRWRLQKNGSASRLQQEVELVDNYMYIMNVRFGGEIHLEKDLDPSLLSLPFPGMTLQPLVENALNHGLREVDYEKHIWLSARRNGDYADISVRDNGVGMPPETVQMINAGSLPDEKQEKEGGNGVGLMNVRERLRLFYQSEDVLHVESSPGGTTVTVHVPVGKGESEHV